MQQFAAGRRPTTRIAQRVVERQLWHESLRHCDRRSTVMQHIVLLYVPPVSMSCLPALNTIHLDFIQLLDPSYTEQKYPSLAQPRLHYRHRLTSRDRMCTRMITTVKYEGCTARPKHESTKSILIPCANPTAAGHTIRETQAGKSTKRTGACPEC